MDPKLLRNYRAKQAPPVFLRTLPTPRPPQGPDWLLILGVTLAGLGLVGFAYLTLHSI